MNIYYFKFPVAFLPIFLMLFGFQSQAQTNYWSVPDASKSAVESEDLLPDLPDFEKGHRVQLDLDGFIIQSKTSKKEGSGSINSSTTVWLPLPDGGFSRFRILESPMMEPGLAAKFPEIKSYLLQGADRPTLSGRMTVSPEGLVSSVSSTTGDLIYYIRPVSKTDRSQYLAFHAADNPAESESIQCEWRAGIEDQAAEAASEKAQMPSVNNTGDELRIYRMAITLPGDLSEQYNWQTKEAALTALLGVLGAINEVYERDLAVRFLLPINQDKIIFLDSDTDPFVTTGGYGIEEENELVQFELIGDENFDLGVILVTGGCCAAGGIGVTCSPNKAGNFSRFWDVRVTCHEIGHQFGGTHTWSYCGGSGETSSTEYGSGASIMAYFGCGANSDILPEYSRLFFGVYSYIQMTNHINGTDCYQTRPTGNAVPVLTVPASGFTIPKETPFYLEAQATDADGDMLTYSWEQNNFLGSNTALPITTAPTSGDVPIQRIFNPTTDPVRIIPQLSDLLANNSTIYERLPTYTRNIKYRCYVRDNHPGAGGTTQDEVSFEVDGNAGPFLVTAPNTCVTWNAGSTQNISWDAANTGAGSTVNCADVKISLSLDGGYTWPHVLAASTPNDGSHTVTLPSGICSSRSRIKIEAVGNIFFDLSNEDFNIEDGSPATTLPGQLSLDAVDDYVDVPDGVYFNGDFTIEAWVYVRSYENWNRLLDFGNYDPSTGVVSDHVAFSLSQGTNGKPVLEVYNGTSSSFVLAPNPLPLHQWVHLAATLQGDNGKIFVDGAQVVSWTGLNSPNNLLRNSCNIGKSAKYDNYANAILDDIRIWNFARSQTAISADKDCALSGTESGLVLYYPMDELACGGCSLGESQIEDKSNNNNHGTALFGAQISPGQSPIQLECPTCTAGNITITGQPSNATQSAGNTATFSVTASGNNIFYQWEKSTDGGTTFNLINGATESSYGFTVSHADADARFRCVLVNGCDVKTTNAATFTLNCGSPSLSSITGEAAPCANVVCPDIFPCDDDRHYTYYVNPDQSIETWHWTVPSGWVVVDDAGNMIVVRPSSTAGNVTVYGTNYCGSNSTVKTLAVSPNVVEITTHPASQTVSEGATASFSTAVSPGGGTTNYTWQRSADGGASFQEVSGVSSATLNLPGTTVGLSGWQFRCIVSNDCFWDTTNVATLTVNCTTTSPPTPESILGSELICDSTTATYSVPPVPGAGSYTWTLPAGWAGSSTTNSISVTSNGSGGVMKVKANNACGTGGERTLDISISAVACSNAVHFDGVDDFISVEQNNQDVQGNFSISFWVKPDRLSGNQMLVFNGREFMVHLVNGAIGYKHIDNCCGYNGTVEYVFNQNGGLTSHTWHHIAITRDVASRTIRYYQNGALMETKTYGGGFAQPGQNTAMSMKFGASLDGTWLNFQGALDEIKIWDDIRTATEIADDQYCIPNGSEANLLAYYGFEQGTPSGNNTGLGTFTNAASAYLGASPNNMALNGPTSNVVSGSKGNGAIDGPSIVCPGGGTVEYAINLPGSPTVNWTLPSGWTGSSTSETITVTPGANAGLITATATLGCGSITLEKPVSTTPVYSNSVLADGTALDFDGVDDHLLLVANTYNNNSLTIEAWVKTTSTDGERNIVGHGSNSTNNSVQFMAWSGKARFGIWDGSNWQTVTSDASISTGEWVHVAVTKQNNDVKIYINGDLDKSGTMTSNPSVSIASVGHLWANGSLGNSSYAFDGQIDEVRIWHEVRSAAQLMDNMYCPIDCAPPNLKLYLPFEDGIAGGNNSLMVLTTDYSIFGNHAEIKGMNLSGITSNFVDGVFTPEIAGPSFICDGAEGSFSIDLPGTPAVAWTLPAGWSGNSTSESITVTAGANGGTITADATLACGTVLNFSKTVSTTPALSNTTLFDGVALDFDGTDDHVLVSPGPTYNNSSMTIEAWVKTTSTDGERNIFGRGSNSTNHSVQFMAWSGKARFGIWDGSNWQTVTSNASINTGEWVHVAVTKQNNDVKIYVNGDLDNSGTMTSNPSVSIASVGHLWANGSLGNSSYAFDGQIDEVRVWNVVRTAQEIQGSMNCPISCPPPSLQLYLPFEDGTIGGGSQATVADYSTYSHTANLNNFNFNTSPISSNFIGGMALPEMTGPANVQAGETGLTYTIDLPGSPTIDWALPPGWSGTSTSESITVTAGTVGGTISATVNGCETTIEKTVTVENQSYCAAGATSTGYEKISNVQFNTINNPSASTAGYEDFTAVSTTVQQGSTHAFTGTISNGYAADEIIVWIDFNQDLDFDDPGEEVFNSPTGVGPHTDNITIPGGAMTGNTRMRVRLHDTALGPNTTPCGNSDYGQVEDYTINITGSSGTAQALDFSGTNDYVIMPASSPAYNNSTFTIEAWIKTTSSSGNRDIVAFGHPTNNQTVEFRVNAGKLEFGIWNGSAWVNLISNAFVNTGNWTHVAVVKNGTSVSLYINGAFDKSGTNGNVPTVSVMTIGHGWFNGSLGSSIYDFSGQIDEVRVWNIAKTAGDIDCQKDIELNGNEAGLAAYYNFNQGTAGGSNPTVTTLNDLTANNYDGTLTNFALTGATSNWVAPGPALNGPGCSSPCPNTLAVPGTISSNTYQAAMDLTSDGTVPNGNTVIFKAGTGILLEPNFEVQQGATFESMIEGCTPFAPPGNGQ